MFFYHLLSLKNLLIYLGLNIIILFFIHYIYADVFIYFIFKKLLNFNQIYAISFYEIIITKINSSLTLTIINFLPFIVIYFLLYIISGLYAYELLYYRKLIKNIFYNYLIILIGGVFIIIPILLNYGKDYESNKLILQIYSYNNLISLIIKIIILWSILIILPQIYQLIIKNKSKNIRSITIIILTIGILSPLTIDIWLQLKLIVVICLYLEIYIIKTLIKKNWNIK